MLNFKIIDNQIDKIICLTCGIFLIFIEAILVLIKLAEKIKNNLEKNYIRNLLKTYSNIIVTVEIEPDIRNLKMMKISNFNDLIDIAEQNKTNIIHYEVVENKDSKFYIIINDCVYFCEVKR